MLDLGSFRGATHCLYFGLHVTLLICFKARVVLSSASLHVVILSVTYGDTTAFSTNRVYIVKHVYSRLTFQTSLMPAEEGRQQWDTRINTCSIS